MAINLATKPNTGTADSDYPYGYIKDDDGSGNGTPVNAEVYGDFHQFFARMFAKSKLTYNNLPDSEYSGFQYYEAARKLFSDGIGVVSTATGLALNFQDHYNKLIFVDGALALTTHTLINPSLLEDGAVAMFYNNSDFEVVIQGGGSIMGGSDVSLYKNGDWIKLRLDKANSNWVFESYNITIAKTGFTSISTEPTGDFTIPATVQALPNDFEIRLNNKTNEVEFRGFVEKGVASGTSSIVVYKLASGIRPARIKQFVVPAINGSGAYDDNYNLFVFPNGNVSCQPPNNTTICLDSVRFSLDT